MSIQQVKGKKVDQIFKDQPRLFRYKEAVEARLAQLQEPHIKLLTAFVEELRSEVGSANTPYFVALRSKFGSANISIPYFDPWDGGINAECLFLFEAPGRKAVESDFISRNNNDPSAANFFKFSDRAGLLRKCTVSWNIVPWYIGSQAERRRPTEEDIGVGVPHLISLLDHLPKVHAVVLFGDETKRAKPYLSRLRRELQISDSPLPSPLFVNRSPQKNGDRIVKALVDVRQKLSPSCSVDFSTLPT